MKEVVALELGVYREQRRRKGTKFFVEDDESAAWYAPVAGNESAVAEPEGPAVPMTLREHGEVKPRRNGVQK